MTERLTHSWDDDKGSHSVCSECLRAFGNAAACQSDIEPQEAMGGACEYVAETEKDRT